MKTLVDFIKEMIEDERDKASSVRITGAVLSIFGLFMLIFSIILKLISDEMSSLCFDSFKFLLSSTGPVVILLTSSQAKSAISSRIRKRGEG